MRESRLRKEYLALADSWERKHKMSGQTTTTLFGGRGREIQLPEVRPEYGRKK